MLNSLFEIAGLALLLLAPIPLTLWAQGQLFPHEQTASRAIPLWQFLLLFLSSLLALAHVLGIAGCLTRGALAVSLVVMLAAGCALCARQSFARFTIISTDLRPSEKMLMAGVLALWGGVAWIALTMPFSEQDTIGYHLPTIAHWMQIHRFATHPQYLTDSVGFYPYGWEALGALFLLLTRHDAAILFINAMAVALLGLSVYCLGRENGAPRYSALLATAMLLGMPVVLHSFPTLHTDVQMTAFLFSAALAISGLYHRQNPAYLALCILGVSLAMAVKASGAVFAAFGFLALAGCAAIQWRALYRNFALRHGAALIGSLLISFITGGYWLWMNWRKVGNPLGKLEVKVGSHVVFPGAMDAAFVRQLNLAGLFHLNDPQHWRVLGLAVAEWLHAPLFVLLVMIAASAMALLARREKRVYSWRFLALAFALFCASIVIYWHSPFSADNGLNHGQITPWIGQQLRFALPALAMLAVLAAGFRVYGNQSWLTAMALVALAFAAHATSVFLPMFLALLLLLVFLAISQKHRKLSSLLLIASLLLALVGGLHLRRANNNRIVGPLQHFLRKTLKRDEVLGYTLSLDSYYLYGRDLSQKLVYLPPGESATKSQWLEQLHRRKIRYVAAGPAWFFNFQQAKEYAWLQDRAQFHPQFGRHLDREIVIYMIKP